MWRDLIVCAAACGWHDSCSKEDFAVFVCISRPGWSLLKAFVASEHEDRGCRTARRSVDASAVSLHARCLLLSRANASFARRSMFRFSCYRSIMQCVARPAARLHLHGETSPAKPRYARATGCRFRHCSPSTIHHRPYVRQTTTTMCGSDVFLGLIAILFPPIAVWVKRGLCSADSLINIALCCTSTQLPHKRRRFLTQCTGLGFLPGLLHAWYIIITYPDETYTQVPQDAEQGNVTYYYVQTSGPQYTDRLAPKPQRAYGTVNNTPNAQFPAQQQGFVQPPAPAGPSEGDAPPPSYQQATGDHKVQGP